MNLTDKQANLFENIVTNRRALFCRKSNCITSSLRVIARKLGYKSTTPIEALYSALKLQGVMRYVEDINGNKLPMINPDAYFDHYQQERRFMKAMFDLGSHSKACEYINICRYLGCYFCIETGEVLEEYDYQVMKKHRNTEGRFDSDKLRKVA